MTNNNTATKVENQDLKDKAIDIHGKKYVLVSDRILAFNNMYPNGSIKTELVSAPDAQMVVVTAAVTPDENKPQRFFTGYSQAKWGDGYINKTSALENAETSAVGRAMAMLGIGVIDSIASADEMVKAEASKNESPKAQVPSVFGQEDEPPFPGEENNKALENCMFCGKPYTEKKGQTANGKTWHGLFCESGERKHTKWIYD